MLKINQLYFLRLILLMYTYREGFYFKLLIQVQHNADTAEVP